MQFFPNLLKLTNFYLLKFLFHLETSLLVFNMKTIAVTAVLMLFAAAVSGLDKPLDIKVTKTATCEKKSQKGDKIEVHYRGTLEADGAYKILN